MRKILFFSLMVACLFSFGKSCKKKQCCKKKATSTTSAAKLNANEVWMRYDETKCENPWHFNWFVAPTADQILSAVKSELLGREINILEMYASYDKNAITCDACTCPNGTHYFVRINKSEIEKLKELKFYEVKNITKIEKTDNTK